MLGNAANRLVFRNLWLFKDKKTAVYSAASKRFAGIVLEHRIIEDDALPSSQFDQATSVRDLIFEGFIVYFNISKDSLMDEILYPFISFSDVFNRIEPSFFQVLLDISVGYKASLTGVRVQNIKQFGVFRR